MFCFFQKKCDQYWPKEGFENYGLIQVRLLHEEILATYTIRKFSIKHLKVLLYCNVRRSCLLTYLFNLGEMQKVRRRRANHLSIPLH